jgi:hypothetical protein
MDCKKGIRVGQWEPTTLIVDTWGKMGQQICIDHCAFVWQFSFFRSPTFFLNHKHFWQLRIQTVLLRSGLHCCVNLFVYWHKTMQTKHDQSCDSSLWYSYNWWHYIHAGDINLGIPLTNQLTQWSWAIEKLPVAQLLKNCPTFYGTRKLVTVFITALQWALSYPQPEQSIP